MLLFTSSTVYSQFNSGDIELGFSGSLGFSSISNNSDDETSSNGYSQIFLSPGYYIIDGLSITADLGIYLEKYKGDSKLYAQKFGIINLSYTYRFPNTKIAIFGKGGYGLSNTPLYQVPDYIIEYPDNNLNAKIINLGCGMKFLASNNVALTSELNYRFIKWTSKYPEYDAQNKIDMMYEYKRFNIIFGMILIF
jgi:hypothetical protein